MILMAQKKIRDLNAEKSARIYAEQPQAEL